jgi:hypothetical protein
MNKKKVKVIYVPGDDRVIAELPDNVPVGELLPALLEGAKRPSFQYKHYEVAGTTFPSHGLFSKALQHIIPLSQTLAEAGVSDGDTLRLLPNVSTGRPSLERVITLASGRRFQELIAIVALQFGETVTAFAVRKDLVLGELANHTANELLSGHQRPQVSRSFREFCEDAGLTIGEGGELHPRHKAKQLILTNESTKTIIDTLSDARLDSVIQTGDCISIKAADQPDTITLDLDGEKDLIDQIEIYPGEE